MSERAVLVVASEPMLAALIGGLVEATGLMPVFPAPRESVEQALERVNPLAAILADARRDEAASDLLLARARRREVEFLVFGSREDIARRQAWTDHHDVRCFALPRGYEQLHDTLRELRDVRGTRGADTDRRTPPGVTFTDASGMRWSVYDRRGGDRRQILERHFINDAGDERECVLTADEVAAVDAVALAAQFARATPTPR